MEVHLTLIDVQPDISQSVSQAVRCEQCYIMGSGQQSTYILSLSSFLPSGPSQNLKPLMKMAADIEIVREKTEKSAEEVIRLYDSFKEQFPKGKIFKKSEQNICFPRLK